eukprot:15353765-Ditylum_brightwellii.AAC.1
MGEVERVFDILFRVGRSFEQVIELCAYHNIILTETLVEKLSSAQSSFSLPSLPLIPSPHQQMNNDNSDSERKQNQGAQNNINDGNKIKNEKLKRIANACEKQGSFQLACKKYTQAGDRYNAMKCLLKTGDTKSIISLASVSRRKDTYVMAANYLQAQ